MIGSYFKHDSNDNQDSQYNQDGQHVCCICEEPLVEEPWMYKGETYCKHCVEDIFRNYDNYAVDGMYFIYGTRNVDRCYDPDANLYTANEFEIYKMFNNGQPTYYISIELAFYGFSAEQWTEYFSNARNCLWHFMDRTGIEYDKDKINISKCIMPKDIKFDNKGGEFPPYIECSNLATLCSVYLYYLDRIILGFSAR